MRTSWDETWLATATVVAGRSKCDTRQVGAVLVSEDNGYLVVGYNGPPAGYPAEGTCNNWCPRRQAGQCKDRDYLDCPSVHAELNALLRADRSLLTGGTAYITTAPCYNCAKALANSGLKRVVYPRTPEKKHRSPAASLELLEASGLEVEET